MKNSNLKILLQITVNLYSLGQERGTVNVYSHLDDTMVTRWRRYHGLKLEFSQWCWGFCQNYRN